MGDLVEAPAGGDGPVVDEPEELALPDGDAVDLGVARGDRDGAGRERLERLVHLPHVRLRRAARVVDDERGEAGRDRLRAHDPDGLRREPRRLLGRHDDVRVVRQHDDLGRGRRLDRVEDVLRRRVHRLPALDDPSGPEAREQAPVALARDDGHDLGRLVLVRRRLVLGVSRSSRATVCACMFAISIRSIVPWRTPSDSAAPGSSVWTCTLSAVVVADDEERVAEPLQLLLEAVGVEALALDHERRCSSGTPTAPGGRRRR